MRVAPLGAVGGTNSVATSDCDQKNVRVYVDGVEVPTVDSSAEDDQFAVEVQLRKDGPGAISRLSDVYVPAIWKDKNVWQALPFGADDETVPVHIEAQALDFDTDEWETLHYGWLRKIGSGGDGRLLRFRVDDYVKILQSEYVSGAFETQSRTLVNDVAEKVRSSLQDKGMDFGFVDETGLTTKEESEVTDVPLGPRQSIAEATKKPSAGIRHFEADRDTLVDVLNWAVDQEEGVYWYIDYNGERPVIKITGSDWPSYAGHSTYDYVENWNETHDTDDVVRIRKNLSLQDLNPVNTLVARGRSGVSVGGFTVPGGSIISDNFPIAAVTHDRLLERADGVHHEKQVEVDAVTIETAKNKARSKLIETISGAGESTMTLNGEPSIIPHSDIYATPVCNQYLETDVPPMKFGIERVVHKIPATEHYTTEIYTNISVDPDDISVDSDRTTMAKTKGTEESADEITSFGRTGSGFGIR